MLMQHTDSAHTKNTHHKEHRTLTQRTHHSQPHTINIDLIISGSEDEEDVGQGRGEEGPDLLHWMEADSRESQESFRSWICFRTTGTPSGEVFLCTDSPRVISIFSWISFSCRAASRA